MRISDWSSDVCSSDLRWRPTSPLPVVSSAIRSALPGWRARDNAASEAIAQRSVSSGEKKELKRNGDRKSVVEGKRGAVRGDLGGLRRIKKNNNITTYEVSG